MITLNYKSETYLVKNGLDEYTIQEFEDLSKILNDTTKEPEFKWVEIFQYLGVPEYVIADLSVDDCNHLMEAFNFVPDKYPIRKVLDVDGVVCRAYTKKFRVTVKEAILIDEYIRKDEHHYLAEVLAILYKSQYLNKEENYDKKVIKAKAKYIRKYLTADIALPVLDYIISRMINNIPNE